MTSGGEPAGSGSCVLTCATLLCSRTARCWGAFCCLGLEPWRGSRDALLDGDHVDRLDVGLGGEQVASDLGHGFGYLAVDVGLAGVLRLESVEDAVVGVVELERG